MPSPILPLERRGPALLATFDRPESRNAVDEAMANELEALCNDLEAGRHGDARALVLAGRGPSFLSGADLKMIRERPREESLAFLDRVTALLNRLERLPVPVLAAVHGYAYGGGAELLLACDYRVAEPAARLSFRQAAMGLTTGWGGVSRFPRHLPRGVAARLLFSAEVIDGGEAAALGLVEELVGEGESVARCLTLAEVFAQNAPGAIAGFKALLRMAYGSTPEESRRHEREALETLWRGPDHDEAVDAFFAKRRPHWRSLLSDPEADG